MHLAAAYLVEAMAAQLAVTLAMGLAGPLWHVEEVKGLLRTALAKIKPWMPPDMYAQYKFEIVHCTGYVEAAAAGSPGPRMLPSFGGHAVRESSFKMPQCNGCGKQSPSLNSSVRQLPCGSLLQPCCQVRHWKQGGHKQECPQRNSGGASGSRS